MMELSLRPLNGIKATQLCEISRDVFADYIAGPYHMQIEEADHILSSNYVNLEYSRIVESSGRPVGYVLVSTNSDRARIASMGFRPEARRNGLGRLVLESLKRNLKQNAFRSLELEVFEQNEPGVRLYESQGFTPLRRLLGFSGPVGQSERDNALASIEMQEAAGLCTAFDNSEMPWQTSAWRVRQLIGRNFAWKLGGFAVAVTSKPQLDRIALTTLMVHPDHRRQGLGRKMIKAIQGEFPYLTIKVPPLCPEEAEPFFSFLGFTRLRLNQIQMRTVL